jgi:ketosteroid isomerase-like protein
MTGFFQAFAQGDLDTQMSLLARDAAWEEVELGATFVGVAAIRAFLEEVARAV